MTYTPRPGPISAVYADCIHRPCRTCSSAPGEPCRNPINRLPRRIPCVTRTRDESETR